MLLAPSTSGSKCLDQTKICTSYVCVITEFNLPPFYQPLCDVIYKPVEMSKWKFVVSLIFLFRFLIKMNKEFKRRPLRSMNAALKRTGQALAKITPDRKRCLDAVTRCQTLFAWLKSTISGDFGNKLLAIAYC